MEFLHKHDTRGTYQYSAGILALMQKNFFFSVFNLMLGPVIKGMTIYFQFDFIYFVQFNLHLIGRKVNLQAVIFKRVKFDKNSFWTFFVRFLRSIWGVCPTRRGVSHETEANHANICLVVDCFRGEIHQSRETGPLERLQPDGP